MKKILFSLLLVVLFIPLIVNAENCEPNKITIKSINLNATNAQAEEKNPPEINGRSLNLDVKMSEVGASIEYKVVIKNDSDEAYELDKNAINLSSDYIDYTLKTSDDSNIVKAGETKEIILTLKYVTEVPNDSYVNGVYRDNKSMVVNLDTNTNDTVTTNPKTGINYVLIVTIVLITGGTLYIVLRKKKYAKVMLPMLLVVSIIPISVYAACKIEIKIDSNVEISKIQKFCIYGYEGNNREFEYETGMTWDDWRESEYYDSEIEYINAFEAYNYDTCHAELKEKYNSIDKTAPDFSWEEYWRNYEKDFSTCGDYFNHDSLIVNKSIGCYTSWPV